MIRNERLKLLATTLSNLGLAFAVGGFVAPTLSGRLGGWVTVVAAVAWFVLGVFLHLCAQAVLGRMRA